MQPLAATKAHARDRQPKASAGASEERVLPGSSAGRLIATRPPRRRQVTRPKFIGGLLFNRANRRRLEKAARCIERATKIPAKVRVALGESALKHIADHHGMQIDGTGRVLRKTPSAVAGIITVEAPVPL